MTTKTGIPQTGPRCSAWACRAAAASFAALACGCTTPQQIAVAATAVGGLTPGQEIEQIYYLGVLDPQEQLPTSLYRVHVRGEASLISRMKFQSGWVPSNAVDSLTVTPAFGPGGGVVIDRTGEREALEEAARKDADLEAAVNASKDLSAAIDALGKAEEAARKAADALEPKGATLDLLVAVVKRSVDAETAKTVDATVAATLKTAVNTAVVGTLPKAADFGATKPDVPKLCDEIKKKGDAAGTAAAKTDGPLSVFLGAAVKALAPDAAKTIATAVGDVVDADPLLADNARFAPRLSDDVKSAAAGAIRDAAVKQAGDAADDAFDACVTAVAPSASSNATQDADTKTAAKKSLRAAVEKAVRTAADAALAGKVDVVAAAVRTALSERGGETKSWTHVVALRADADGKKAEAETKKADLTKKRLAEAEARAKAAAAHAVAAATTDGVSESLVRAQLADGDSAALNAECATLDGEINKLKQQETDLRGQADPLEPKGRTLEELVERTTKTLKEHVGKRLDAAGSAKLKTDTQDAVKGVLPDKAALGAKAAGPVPLGDALAAARAKLDAMRTAVTPAGGPASVYLRTELPALCGAAEPIGKAVGDVVDVLGTLAGKARFASKMDDDVRKAAVDAVRDDAKKQVGDGAAAAFETWLLGLLGETKTFDAWFASLDAVDAESVKSARDLVRKTVVDAVVAVYDDLVAGKLEVLVTAVRVDLAARGGEATSWNHVVALRNDADAKKKAAEAKGAELKTKKAAATQALAKAAAARAAAELAKNGSGFKIGRRLVLFGPEGFRESPANHRLVILMGSSPEDFFKAASNTVVQADQILSAKESAPVAMEMLEAMNELASATARLGDAEKSASSELGVK